MNDTFEYLQSKAIEDPRWIIERFFWIIDKNKRQVPFKLNPVQDKFYRERAWRDTILKARKEGMSSLIEAIFAVAFLFYPNTHLATISHETEATKRLFERGRCFIETADKVIPRKLSLYSKKMMRNELTGSTWYIGTAGSKAFGRGDDIHMLHFSEPAYYEHWDMVTGAVEAVPAENKDTWVVFETTANGMGLHYDHYQDAVQGRSVYEDHFFAWFENPEYRLPIEGPTHKFEETLKQEEQHLISAYDLDLEQINWRRMKIRSLTPLEGYSREDTFRQEYPANPKEAFLFSGNPFFNVEAVSEYFDNVREPVAVGNLSGIEPVVFDQTDKGYLKIWETPAKGGQYVLFADVAESGDYCAAYVVDKKEWEIVAGWHGHINPGEFGTELDRLGRWYNDALIAVEVNGMGQSTIDKLHNDLHYPNLYKRKVINKATEKETDRVGWRTTTRTRPQMLGNFQELVRSRQIGQHDKMLLEEMRTFIRSEDGKAEALEGKHDDRVIAAAGAFQVLKEHPYVEKVKTSSRRYKLPYKTLRWNRKKG